MAKFTAKSRSYLIAILSAAALLLIVALFVVPRDSDQPTAPSETIPLATGSAEQPLPVGTTPAGPAKTDPQEDADPAFTVAFPLDLEDGRLRIETLFTYDGMNPDCGYEESNNIATITLRNLSGQHLDQADIGLTMSDGTVLQFHADQIPAGKSALLFCIDNTALVKDSACLEVACSASFSSASAQSDDVLTSMSGTTIEVVNTSGRNIKQIVIYCHNLLGEEYFGGIAYPYEINDLSADGRATVNALDCFLGVAELSRIDVIFE